MKKSYIVVLIILITTVVVIIQFADLGQSKSANTSTNTPTIATNSINKLSENSSLKYITDHKAGLTVESTKKVIFFYANWCPTCIPVDKELSEKESQIPDGVIVIRVNYNDTDTDQSEKELAKKYGVTYQHTFVQIDSDGNVITKWNGGSLNELTKNIK
jgi:thioredoxin 1